MALKAYAGGQLFGASYGEGPPSILALHGWGRDHHDFDDVLLGFDAVALDLPGFGASPAPNEAWGATEYADAVMNMMEMFDQPPVVVGHSFGGRVAVSLAARHPRSVRSLLLIGVPLLHPLDRKPSRLAPRYRLARWAYRRGMVPESRMEQARQRHGSADYKAAEGVMRDILVKVVNESYEEELAALAIPVDLLWGSGDTAAPLSVAERARDLLAARGVAVTMTALDGVGHHVMIEAPQEVRTHLSTVEGN